MSGLLGWTNAPVVLEGEGSKSKELSEVLREHDLVAVTDDVVVVTPKQLAETPDLRELGSASHSPFTSYLRAEYNRDLMGSAGLQKYDQMRKSDGTVRGTLRQIKTPILGARWFVEAASESTRDQNAADFVWWNLQKAMSISFGQIVHECLLMLDFGYYMFEKVWKETRWNNRDVLCWQKLAPRHPVDVIDGGWHYDKNGGPASVDMINPDATKWEPINISIEKLLVMSFDKEAGNIEGFSVLRSAYSHWYYKTMLYKIDAIQKERHGIGVPVIKLPPNFTRDDKEIAQQMGRNLRTNETAHLVLPPNWEDSRWTRSRVPSTTISRSRRTSWRPSSTSLLARMRWVRSTLLAVSLRRSSQTRSTTTRSRNSSGTTSNVWVYQSCGRRISVRRRISEPCRSR
jgi:hypothetical protein